MSAAVASMITAIVAGGTSVILVSRQLEANKELEDHKGRILNEIEEKRISATNSLEDKRVSATSALEDKKISATLNLEDKRISATNSLEDKRIGAATDLDERKQRLGHELGLERIRIETSHQQVVAAVKAISEYRRAVNSLARGEFDKDDATELVNELDVSIAFLRSNAGLYSAVELFRHRGLYLVERAEALVTREEQMNLWREASREATDGNKALGVCFAADAEKLIHRLKAEDEAILKGQ